MMIGIAPSTGGDALKIAIGGWIALAVIDYVASEWKKFDWIARLEADGASRWRSFMNWSNSALVLGQNIRVGSGKTEGGSPGRVVLCSPLCPAAFAIPGLVGPFAPRCHRKLPERSVCFRAGSACAVVHRNM